MKQVEVRLVGRFRFQARLPGIHQHLLYKAVHTQTNGTLFLKGEQIRSRSGPHFLTILQEGKILQTMQGGIGVPHMNWCGVQEDYNFIVMEELDCDLTSLISKCGGSLTFKSVMMLGIQMISILQYCHFKTFLHNHINPKHIMIGKGENYGKFYLIDYSNAIRYKDPKTLDHISESKDRKSELLSINLQFSSMRYHRGLVPSCKDDLISLLYLLYFCLEGQLPWSKLLKVKMPQNEHSKAVLQQKIKNQPENLFKKHPILLQLYKYTAGLAFEEKPRYNYYKNVLRQSLQKEGYIDDKIYDWYLLEDSDEAEKLDLKFQILPNEEEFLQSLQAAVREKDLEEISRHETKNQESENPKKAKNGKQCIIF